MSYTKADKERIDKFRHIGCIATGLAGYDVHHITRGGRRMGNQYTIPLSPWSHRGVCAAGFSKDEMTKMYGPSLAYSKKDFIAKFGTEMELLAKVNERLEQYK